MTYRISMAAAILLSLGPTTVPAQDDLPSLLRAGAGLESRGDWLKAADVYKKAAAMYPTQSIGFEQLGILYQKNADLPAAVENYRKALEVSPGDEALRHLLEVAERAAAQEKKDGVVRAGTYRDLDSATRSVKAQTVPAFTSEPERIPVHVAFPRNRYSVGDLDATARRQLDEVAEVLKSQEWLLRRPVVIEGHTCSCGSTAANLELGRKRADAVLQYLIAKNALRPGEGTVLSMGKSSPVVPSATENLGAAECARDEAHNRNRRVIVREAGHAASPQVSFFYKSLGSSALKPLANGDTIYRNDEVRVKVQSPTPLFAYVVHHGPDNSWRVLYRRPGAAAAAPKPESSGADGYWLPGDSSGFSVRGQPGNEEALVYLSPSPIRQFEARPGPAPPVNRANVVRKPEIKDEGSAKEPESSPPPAVAPSEPPKPVVGINEVVVRSLAPSTLLLSGPPPRGLSPVAVVRFKSHE
jgi:outer membrane protein OmpA-like peptidoglycan-associated protein